MGAVYLIQASHSFRFTHAEASFAPVKILQIHEFAIKLSFLFGFLAMVAHLYAGGT
jgi:hypothetical protein